MRCGTDLYISPKSDWGGGRGDVPIEKPTQGAGGVNGRLGRRYPSRGEENKNDRVFVEALLQKQTSAWGIGT